MASVLATLAALAVIGLLFALDPGGAIAESGFPDFREMDWKQLTAWGFRTIGVGVGLLLVLWLWVKYSPKQEIKHQDPLELGTRRRPGMSAAAVSVLEDRLVSDRTLLAAIVEMCQRGTLQVECVETESGYRYRLSKQGPAQFDWEQLICNRLPSRPTTVQELRDGITKREDVIGSQLGKYLQDRGLFDDNPMRVMRQHGADGFELEVLAIVLMGVGGGLWMALWLSQWWANSLVGAFIGFIYMLIATPNTGILPATEAGAYEIGQWLGWKGSLPGPDREAGRDGPDSMLAYAIALDEAQPWLDVSLPAPAWFGSGEPASLSASDLDVAYHGFMSAPAWGLAGRSRGAAEAAAEPYSEAEQELSQELSRLAPSYTEQAEGTANSQGGGGPVYERPQTEGVTPETEARGETTADPPSSPLGYRKYRSPGQAEEKKDGRGCGGCFMWVVRLLGIGALLVAVLLGINLASPAVDPCPADSPGIPPPGLLGVALDVFLDECVSVAGEVVSHDVGELVVEVDRGEYVQWVRVRAQAEVFEQVSVGGGIRIAGRIAEHEDGGYVVLYGVDRGWWGNLRENLPGDVLTP